jgi:hypothetical protein
LAEGEAAMALTDQNIKDLHPVYKDFMTALKPIIDSRTRPFQIRGLPASQIYDASARKYGFSPEQFYEIAENLRKQGYIEVDKFGLIYPTGSGEALIGQLLPDDRLPSSVPPLELEG